MPSEMVVLWFLSPYDVRRPWPGQGTVVVPASQRPELLVPLSEVHKFPCGINSGGSRQEDNRPSAKWFTGASPWLPGATLRGQRYH
ncbi:unnamed protein product [Boreogadus saida]